MNFGTDDLAMIALLLDEEEEKKRRHWVHPIWMPRETEGCYIKFFYSVCNQVCGNISVTGSPSALCSRHGSGPCSTNNLQTVGITSEPSQCFFSRIPRSVFSNPSPTIFGITIDTSPRAKWSPTRTSWILASGWPLPDENSPRQEPLLHAAMQRPPQFYVTTVTSCAQRTIVDPKKPPNLL
ncbi:hypothetical protein GE061_018443 [Apolygus lucorum]|uniref:Uncharacterized protein n=1 Tax=Apolygus lucorum TaxID=248454 RepID=A0A8S9XE20_APOLU|nr:hypothetical protein GE061_018443 [Apolygus lucorum]